MARVQYLDERFAEGSRCFLKPRCPCAIFQFRFEHSHGATSTVCPGTREDVLQELALINVAFSRWRKRGGFHPPSSSSSSSLRPTAKGATASYLKHTHTDTKVLHKKAALPPHTSGSTWKALTPLSGRAAPLLFCINANYLILSSMQIRWNEGTADCPWSTAPCRFHSDRKGTFWDTSLLNTLIKLHLEAKNVIDFFYCHSHSL